MPEKNPIQSITQIRGTRDHVKAELAKFTGVEEHLRQAISDSLDMDDFKDYNIWTVSFNAQVHDGKLRPDMNKPASPTNQPQKADIIICIHLVPEIIGGI